MLLPAACSVTLSRPGESDRMSARADIVHRLDSSHSPFLSHPAELAAPLGAAG